MLRSSPLVKPMARVRWWVRARRTWPPSSCSDLVQCLATQALNRGQQNPRVGRVTIRSRNVQRSPPPQIEQTAFGLMHMTVQRYERYESDTP